jgi:hypothetical protein
MSNFTPKVVYDKLCQGLTMDYNNIPDEFYKEIQVIENFYKNKFYENYYILHKEYLQIKNEFKVDEKTFALHLKDNTNKSEMFLIHKNKNELLESLIWKKLKEFKI